MRIGFAWILLLLTLSSWIGGLLCFEIRYYIDLQRSMNKLEQVISEQVKQEIGTESTIRIIDNQNHIPRGYVYGDWFVFSSELEDGNTVYYTIENESQKSDYQIVELPKENPVSDSNQAILFKSLIQEFVMPIAMEILSTSNITNHSSFFYLIRTAQCWIITTTPPPDLQV